MAQTEANAAAQQLANIEKHTQPQHAAATVVRTGKTVLNDTKAIIESTTGIGRTVESRLPYFQTPADPDAVGKNVLEFYPVYSPLGGITVRVERYSGQPALWTDMTLREAKAAAEDLLSVIEEIERADLADDPDLAEARQSAKDANIMGGKQQRSPGKGVEKPRYVPTYWLVTEFDPERDPAEKADLVPVISNKRDAPVVWFKDKKTADEIVDRLNNRGV